MASEWNEDGGFINPNTANTTNSGSNGIDPESFEMPTGIAPPTGTAQIEAESSGREIPPGEHVMMVAGFIGQIKQEYKQVTLGSRAGGYNCYTVAVKLVLANDLGASVVDRFELPPQDPTEWAAYFEGTTGQGKQKGFMARKLMHFLARLMGVDFQPGQQIPAEAARLANWKGRKIIGTIVAGDDYVKEDPKTLEQKKIQGRNQVKLFSYRPADPAIAATLEARTANASSHQPLPGQQGLPGMANAGLPTNQGAYGRPAAPTPQSGQQPANAAGKLAAIGANEI